MKNAKNIIKKKTIFGIVTGLELTQKRIRIVLKQKCIF
jgi:hypothetical protein